MAPQASGRYPKTLGRRLAAARVGMGLSQSQVAEQTGLAQSSISQLENDDCNPSVESITKLADLYAASIDYLLGRDPVPPANAEQAVEAAVEQRAIA